MWFRLCRVREFAQTGMKDPFCEDVDSPTPAVTHLNGPDEAPWDGTVWALARPERGATVQGRRRRRQGWKAYVNIQRCDVISKRSVLIEGRWRAENEARGWRRGLQKFAGRTDFASPLPAPACSGSGRLAHGEGQSTPIYLSTVPGGSVQDTSRLEASPGRRGTSAKAYGGRNIVG